MTSNFIDFFAGCLGGERSTVRIQHHIYTARDSTGVAGVLVGHPLDTVKVKLQTQGMVSNAAKAASRSTIGCLMGTLRSDGVRSDLRRYLLCARSCSRPSTVLMHLLPNHLINTHACVRLGSWTLSWHGVAAVQSVVHKCNCVRRVRQFVAVPWH